MHDGPVVNIRIRVHYLWPAGYSCAVTETFGVRHWRISDGMLSLNRGPGDRTMIPMTSIAKLEVGV